jgi:hypothetical protein
MPSGYELQLLQLQYQRRVSIFACDSYSVYSNRVVEIAEGLQTGVVNSDLTCTYGGEFYTALNVEIFMAVWVQVVAEARFVSYAWTVKVDPDCVFLPDRLRQKLANHHEDPRGVYLNNCKFGLHGPIEVFSRNAAITWARGSAQCMQHFNQQCSGPCAWGEDLFIDQCLWKVLGVKRVDDMSLLVEDHCQPPANWNSCTDQTYAAYHPFKAADAYSNCLNAAQAQVQ